MVFNATFNNISVISWRSVLLVEETGEKHRRAASHWHTLLHNVIHLALGGIRTRKYNNTIEQTKTAIKNNFEENRFLSLRKWLFSYKYILYALNEHVPRCLKCFQNVASLIVLV